MAAAATKRKAPASTGPAAKKAKLAAAGAETVQKVLESPADFELPSTEGETREKFVEISEYARSLEEQLAALKPKEKSPAELKAAANKLAAAANSGIKKQCTWKASCKAGTAKFSYDGVCNDPAVFGMMMNLDGPPTFKTKKIPVAEFDDIIGGLEISARYSYMRLTGEHVNVHWKPEEGTFKFSGTYGV